MFLKKTILAALVLAVSFGVIIATEKSPEASVMTQDHKIQVAFEVMLHKESNGKQFGGPGSVAGKDEPTTSRAGAIGIAQVMPATAKYIAKQKGIKWSKKRYREDATYNRMLGKAYFEEQVKAFNGDLAKAFAAYNAGPTRTRKAIRTAAKNKSDWVKHLPRETRHYVRKNMANFTAALQNPKGTKISLNP